MSDSDVLDEDGLCYHKADRGITKKGCVCVCTSQKHSNNESGTIATAACKLVLGL